jgi:hypothetical protein
MTGSEYVPGPPQDVNARRWFASLLVVVVIGIGSAASVVDRTLAMLIDTKKTTDIWHPPSTVWLVCWWVVLAIGVMSAVTLVRMARDDAGTIWTGQALLGKLAGITVVVWTAWAASEAFSLSYHGLEGLRGAQDYGRWVVTLLVVATLVSLGNAFGVSPGMLWDRAVVIRVHLVILGVLFAFVALFSMTAGQSVDVMRAWGDEGIQRPAAAVAAALLLGEVIRESGLRLTAGATDMPAIAGAPLLATQRAFRAMAAIPLFVLFYGSVDGVTDSLLLDNPFGEWQTVWACVYMLLTGAFLVLLARSIIEPQPQSDPEDGGAPRSQPAPAVASGTWQSSLAQVAFATLAGVAIARLPLLSIVLALALAGFVAWQRYDDRFDESTTSAFPLNIARGIVLGVGLTVLWEPIGTSRGLGMMAVLLFALAGILCVLHSVERFFLNKRVRWLGIRYPVVTGLLVYFLIATHVGHEHQHQARTVTSVGTPTSLEVATGKWLDQELAVANENGGASYLPLLLVGASGGGSKASYWTDLVLDCVVGGGSPADVGTHHRKECTSHETRETRLRRARGVFLTSSVSGGSVGIRNYVKQLPAVLDESPWVDANAGRETLSPTIAWGLFHDFPATLLWLGTNPQNCNGDSWSCRLNLDRAAVQENAMAQRAWDAVPDPADALSRIWRASTPKTPSDSALPAPLTIFNSSVNGSLGRMLISPVDLTPLSLFDDRCRPAQRPTDGGVVGAIDASDMLDKRPNTTIPARDFDVTTAALLSGRFPVVDPLARVGNAGTIRRVDTPNKNPGCLDSAVSTLPAQFVRDGGYVENTGLLTIVEALPAINRGIAAWQAAHKNESPPPVKVWVLSIDDDSAQLDAEPKPEPHRPGMLSIKTRAGDVTLTEMARDALALGTDGVRCYSRVSPRPRPGAHASSGWELSVIARERDLVESVGTGTQNERRLVAIRNFLDGQADVACPETMRGMHAPSSLLGT